MASEHQSVDEAQRLEALRRYDMLDSPPEQSFDDITRLASFICQTPIAQISLIDEHRQWFKSEFGIRLIETARANSLCTHAIQGHDLLIVPDLALDARFSDNPKVTGDAGFRFYAGAPIVTAQGHALGALCVVDHVPRELTPEQQQCLRMLSRQVLAQLELGLKARELAAAETSASLTASQSLRAEREFRALFADNPMAMWIYDQPTLRFLEVNNAAIVRYGFTREEFLAMTIRDIRPPEDVDRLVQTMSIPRDKWQQAGAWRHRLKSGKIIDVEITSHEIRYDDQTAVLVVANDVTTRRLAEEERRASELRYRRLFEAAPDGLVVADSERMYLDCNPSVCRMLGYTREELLGMRARDIVDPERQNLESELTMIRSTSDRFHPMRFRRKDGTTFDAEVNSTPLGDGTVLGIIRDITERQDAHAALRATEERMRYALQCANVGIWDTNLQTGTVKWSEIQEQHYGFAPGTFPGTHEAVEARLHPEDRNSIRELEKQIRDGANDLTVTYRVMQPDGAMRWISGIGRIVRDEDGTPLRATGVSLDVTERRALEEQYQQAQKMEAIGRLAGGVAHDFNNLLTAILGYCELLLGDGTKNASIRDDLEEIQKAGTRAASLTRQLLAFSRKEIIEPRVLDMNEIVTDMKSMLARLIGENIQVKLQLRPGLLPVKADRGQIEQIVMNLAVNARDAMPRGGVLVFSTSNVLLDAHHHETNFRTEPEPFVALSVRDNGVGMSAEVQARAFEPFFTTKEVGKGTGLGLATVHGIVKGAGGAVSIDSEVDRGTTIKVMFPAAPEGETLSHTVQSTPRTQAGVESVLVVEDEDALRELTRRLLLRQGYQVHVAGNAEEAVRLFPTIDVDVVLTDVVMPGSSGVELMERLHVLKPRLKVVYMSGYTDDTIVHHGVLAPGTAFVHKPFTSDALAQTLREVLDR
jgi:two-component system cell cycle sensor histidine kinase/response regulator CckA